MNNVYNLLENKGLVTAEAILEKSKKWSPQETIDLDVSLHEALQEEKRLLVESDAVPESEFRFLASASFRGDSGCDATECRVARTQVLAKYAALYCDQVIVPVRVSSDLLHEGEARISASDLAGTLLCLRELRPLVDAGIVRLVPRSIYLCEACGRALLSKVSDTEESLRALIRKTAKSFSVYRAGVPRGFPGLILEIRGPEEFLEHGHRFALFMETPDWAKGLKPLGSSRAKVKLSSELVRKAGILEGAFSRLVADAAIQCIYGAQYHAKYLTNLPGDAAIISCLGELPNDNPRSTFLLTKLAHRIPFLDYLHPQAILRIRAQDPEPFAQYRLAVTKIINDYVRTNKEFSETEADQIYGDILAPAVARLRTMAREHGHSTRSKAIKTALYATALITVGIYASHLSTQVSTMLETLTGAELLRSGVDAASSVEKDTTAVRTDDFYFLFRLLNQAS